MAEDLGGESLGRPWGYAMSSSDHEVKLTVKALGHQRLADYDVGHGDQSGEYR